MHGSWGLRVVEKIRPADFHEDGGKILGASLQNLASLHLPDDTNE